MIIHDTTFVLADIKRARAELEAALLACDRLLSIHDPETAIRALPITGETVIDSAKRAWQLAISARRKRVTMLKQEKSW